MATGKRMDFFNEDDIEKVRAEAKKNQEITTNKMKRPVPIAYEPKRKNRFIIEFEGMDIPAWLIQTSKRPTFVLGQGWETMEFTLLDPIGPSTTQKLFDNIVNESLKKRFDEKTIHIKLLDPTGVTVEHWEILGEFKLIDFGELNYGKDELMEIKVVFEPSKCVLRY